MQSSLASRRNVFPSTYTFTCGEPRGGGWGACLYEEMSALFLQNVHFPVQPLKSPLRPRQASSSPAGPGARGPPELRQGVLASGV